MIHTVLFNCYCRQLRLCVLSRWRHEIYGIWIRVYLFGLSPRNINLMNLSSSPYNWFCRFCTSHHLMCTSHHLMPLSCLVCMLTTRFSMHALNRIYRYTCAYPCTPLGIHHTSRWGVSDFPLKIVLMFIFPPLQQCVCGRARARI